MRNLTFLLLFSITAAAEIRTCEELEKAARKTLVSGLKHWYGNAIFREQAEKLASYYISLPQYTDWDFLPSIEDVSQMSDEELDQFGEGITFEELTDQTGQSYIYAQFGFGGGNWFSMIFDRNSAQLASRVYEWDGDCSILPKN